MAEARRQYVLPAGKSGKKHLMNVIKARCIKRIRSTPGVDRIYANKKGVMVPIAINFYWRMTELMLYIGKSSQEGWVKLRNYQNRHPVTFGVDRNKIDWEYFMMNIIWHNHRIIVMEEIERAIPGYSRSDRYPNCINQMPENGLDGAAMGNGNAVGNRGGMGQPIQPKVKVGRYHKGGYGGKEKVVLELYVNKSGKEYYVLPSKQNQKEARIYVISAKKTEYIPDYIAFKDSLSKRKEYYQSHK